MTILIVGARGFIGAALARHFSADHEVLALGRAELDVTARRTIRPAILSLLSGKSSGLVINCAVLGVDACEADPPLAWAINASGSEALAEAADEAGAEFLHLSTNYVFDGRRRDDSFYTVEDAPAPVNVYGRTKLAGERAALAAAPRTYVIRTSWVFGPGKENFLSTAHRRLMAGERLRAIADVRASVTHVADLVGRIDEILRRRHYATYHVVNRGLCSYYEFALEAARLAGIGGAEAERLVDAVSEAEMKRSAPRPRHTPLRCLVSEELGFELMPDWRAALKSYLMSS